MVGVSNLASAVRSIAIAALIVAQASRAQPPLLADAPVTAFGVTVVDAYGLRGEIYLLNPGAEKLPKFEKLEPVGAVYTVRPECSLAEPY